MRDRDKNLGDRKGCVIKLQDIKNKQDWLFAFIISSHWREQAKSYMDYISTL